MLFVAGFTPEVNEELGRVHMSIAVMSQVYATKLGGPTIKAVALKLADHANDAGGNIFPSLDTVAEQTEVSKSTVQRCITKLRHRYDAVAAVPRVYR